MILFNADAADIREYTCTLLLILIFLRIEDKEPVYKFDHQQKCCSVLLDVISYVMCLSVWLYVISCNTRQFKVYERLSRFFLHRYYADISLRQWTVFLGVLDASLGIQDSCSIHFSFFLLLSRIFRNSSTSQFRIYEATCEATKWVCKNAEPRG